MKKQYIAPQMRMALGEVGMLLKVINLSPEHVGVIVSGEGEDEIIEGTIDWGGNSHGEDDGYASSKGRGWDVFGE